MKLCKDCKFCWLGEFEHAFQDRKDRWDMLASLAQCHHFSARVDEPPNLVSGVSKTYWRSCRTHREPGYRDDNNCGPHGLYFEPKQPPEPVGFGEPDPDPRIGGAMAELE